MIEVGVVILTLTNLFLLGLIFKLRSELKSSKKEFITTLIDEELPRLSFHYIPGATLPDKIQCTTRGEVLFTYNWIDGEEASPLTQLGKIHAEFRRRDV